MRAVTCRSPKRFEGDTPPFLGRTLHILCRKRRRVGMEVYGQNIASKTGGPLHSIYEERAGAALSPGGCWPVYGIGPPERRPGGPDSLPRPGANHRSRECGNRGGGPGPRESCGMLACALTVV